MKINPELDLILEKDLDISAEKAWKAWTTPELIREWFCPRPWKVIEARIDLRNGGEFFTVMQSPEGDKFPNVGCILDFTPNKKLIWTSALQEGYRPVPPQEGELLFTGEIYFEEKNGKLKYTAIAKHRNQEDKRRHEEMGFHDGWSKVSDQLVELMKSK